MGLFKINELLDPACIFCGYNGPGYYQPHTHRKDCPFFEIGGEAEREHALVVFAKKGWLRFEKQPNNQIHEDGLTKHCKNCDEPAKHYQICSVCSELFWSDDGSEKCLECR